MAIKITLNSREIKKLLKSPEIAIALQPLARQVEATAKATALVDTGRYRDSIHVETGETDRVVKRIGSDVDYALVIESKTGNLSRALDSANLGIKR